MKATGHLELQCWQGELTSSYLTHAAVVTLLIVPHTSATQPLKHSENQAQHLPHHLLEEHLYSNEERPFPSPFATQAHLGVSPPLVRASEAPSVRSRLTIFICCFYSCLCGDLRGLDRQLVAAKMMFSCPHNFSSVSYVFDTDKRIKKSYRTPRVSPVTC